MSWVIQAADKPKEEPRGQFRPENLTNAPGIPALDAIHAPYINIMGLLDDIAVKGQAAIESGQNEVVAREARNYVIALMESLIMQNKKVKDVVASVYINTIDTDTGEKPT